MKYKKYKKIEINRLFHGFASVRDYQVDDARREKLGLEIWWGNEFIHIPYEDLDICFHNDEVFKSKHIDEQKYKLVDYDWATFKRKTSTQISLL